MVRPHSFAMPAAVVLGIAFTPHGLGQPVVGMALQSLDEASLDDFYRRVPGCRAAVVGAAKASPLAAVAQSAWIMFHTSRGTIEAPVIFRDKGDNAPELRFGVSDAALGGLRGTLSQVGAGLRCSLSSGCMEIPARLTLTLHARPSETQTVFDGTVTVVDQCATDPRQRVFATVPWWERVLRLISGH